MKGKCSAELNAVERRLQERGLLVRGPATTAGLVQAVCAVAGPACGVVGLGDAIFSQTLTLLADRDPILDLLACLSVFGSARADCSLARRLDFRLCLDRHTRTHACFRSRQALSALLVKEDASPVSDWSARCAVLDFGDPQGVPAGVVCTGRAACEVCGRTLQVSRLLADVLGRRRALEIQHALSAVRLDGLRVRHSHCC